MEFWTRRALKSILLPGGLLMLGAFLLLKPGLIPLPAVGISFFYYAVFVAAVLLAWRFHSTRILFCAIVLLMAHHAIVSYAQGQFAGPGVSRIAFESVALFVPLDFILLTFFPERGHEGRTLIWFLLLLFIESVIVAVMGRPDQPVPGFLHFSLIHDYSLHLTQPALVAFIVAIGLLLYRLIELHKPIDNGMLWSLLASSFGLEYGAAGRTGTAYFGVAGFILASCIIENSYSLAYQDELTGLSSRRAFNDSLLRLKHPFAIAVVDIDHFKSINDTYGHDTGDHVLRLVASKLARVSGGGETFRVGGEEFTILFFGRTAKEIADHLELLRMNIEGTAFRLRKGDDRRKAPRETDRRARAARKPKTAPASAPGFLSVTVSIGLAESHPRAGTEEVIQHADKALYRAKQGGRNRLEIATAPGKVRRVVKSKKTLQS
ncbi:MAG TPA: GGDEF domain-containing protein [Terriglobales bacterium]|jgi:diguanylate cyclase (GGDEF)-like protein